MDIKTKKDFDQLYARRDLRKKENLIFYAFSFFLVSIVMTYFAIKAYDYRNYDETKVKISSVQKQRLFYLIEQAYGAVDKNEVLARRAEEIKKREEIERIRNEEIRKEVERLIEEQKEIEALTQENQRLVNEIAVITSEFKLAELDELDDILANFSEEYEKDVNSELELSRAVLATRVSRAREIRAFLLRPGTKKTNLINFGEVKEDKFDNYQGFRTQDEIKEINSVMRKNEFLIENCIKKFQIQNPEIKGFFKVEFRIDSIGNIKNESVKITDSNLKSEDLIECVIKRIKRIRGFSKASMKKANDYIFKKKWVLN